MSRMLRALDLFCGAGGASRGLADAGFEVFGVDIEPQPNYTYKIIQEDALRFLKNAHMDLWIHNEFDFIWASPPCQAFTAYKRRPAHVKLKANLIPQVRQLLRGSGKPYVIENVGGAPLINPVMLCGSMFGLDVQRHRYFESSFPITQPKCDHGIWTPRFAPATNRKNLRKTVEVGVWRIPLEVQQKAMGIDWMTLKELSQAIPLEVQQKAMGIDWMTLKELSQAIPPAYSYKIAKDFMEYRKQMNMTLECSA